MVDILPCLGATGTSCCDNGTPSFEVLSLWQTRDSCPGNPNDTENFFLRALSTVRVGGAKQNLVGAQFHSWSISKSRSPVMESKTSGDATMTICKSAHGVPNTGSDLGLDHHDIVHQTISTRRPEE